MAETEIPSFHWSFNCSAASPNAAKPGFRTRRYMRNCATSGSPKIATSSRGLNFVSSHAHHQNGRGTDLERAPIGSYAYYKPVARTPWATPERARCSFTAPPTTCSPTNSRANSAIAPASRRSSCPTRATTTASGATIPRCWRSFVRGARTYRPSGETRLEEDGHEGSRARDPEPKNGANGSCLRYNPRRDRGNPCGRHAAAAACLEQA